MYRPTVPAIRSSRFPLQLTNITQLGDASQLNHCVGRANTEVRAPEGPLVKRERWKGNEHVNSEQGASRLLGSISESINFDPDKLAPVAGQFITPNGNQVYPFKTNGFFRNS